MKKMNIIVNEPQLKEYRLMYFYGTWHTSSLVIAETDKEAIFDADNEMKNNPSQKLPYALFLGNRKVKDYASIELKKRHGCA